MKKHVIILLMLLISVSGYAQRMVYKQKAVEVTVGILDSKEVNGNYYLNLTVNSFGRHGNYWIWGGEYQRRNIAFRQWNVPVDSYMGELGFSKQLLSDKRKFITLNLGVTAAAGYEIVNKGENILFDGARLEDQNQFVYGAGGRLSIETYLSDRIVFLLQGKLKVLWGTDLEQFRPGAGAGFRINF
ncbi:conjugal transfer protein TraO [Chryseobacterium pennae]|uniref:Conjugal transfer protein TraO n=1 Tax=Chryseobacterium pennae TaxID=2258962 RepID=A0A3D9C7G5_9FLAO|nr:conjugal transfer protein TraO [Chryseobacterium pennae]REC61837.1 conjugal transfer protein TraO [Chryseobacterium pennae]